MDNCQVLMGRKIAIIVLIVLAIAGVAFWLLTDHVKTLDTLTLYGNVDVREVQLGFRVSGRVQEMAFEEGDLVQKGSFMGTLDKQPYLDRVLEADAAVKTAKFELLNAEEVYLRRQILRGTGAISDEDYTNALSSRDIAYSRHKEAEAALLVAETNLRDTQVFAPADGTILTRIREPGTVVNVADPIYSLSVLSPVWVRAYVSEPELGLIYPGMRACVYTDTPKNTSEGSKVYYGHIGFISPVAEFTPKTVQTTQLRTDLVYRLRIIVENPDLYFKQGMPVTVELQLTPDKKRRKFIECPKSEIPASEVSATDESSRVEASE